MYIDSGSQPEQFGANLLHVFPYFALLFRGTQEIGRMECCNDTHSVHVEEFSAQSRNRRCRLKHGLRGESAEAAHDFRTDRSELLFQEWIAGSDFIRLGIPVIRRPALEDIANVDVFAFEIDGLDDLCQELSRPADERQALLVFVITRSLAHEYEFSVATTGTEDQVGALRGQLTALAVAEFGADSVEVLDIWAVIARCCALSRLRFAARCCALSRLRFAARCCALSRLRFADRPYSQRVHTDVFEELQLGS